MPSQRNVVVALVVLSGLAPAAAQAQIYTRTDKNGVIEATNVPDGAGFRLAYPGKGTLIHSRGFRFSYRGEYDRHIRDASTHHGVSEELVKAVIQVESEFDRLAVSSKGAQGLMQLMPFTARRFGVGDPFDARQNIFGGVHYLRLLLDLFQGNVSLALAAYNAGENAVLRFNGIPPFKETQKYVQKIQALLSGGFQVFSAAASTATTQMMSFTPNGPTPPRARPAKIVPARPRIFYKWRDERGQFHAAQDPPAEGIAYTMIRALD